MYIGLKLWQIECKRKKYQKGVYRTGVENIPYKICVWNKDSKRHKPKDFDLNCGKLGYITEVI